MLPHYNNPGALDLTLAALAEQSYPNELLEAVVVDDGSDLKPTIRDELRERLRVRVVEQPRDGFGLARARNLGAQHAEGSILVLLDCDMVPERQFVEAHARWHHLVQDAVTIGFRRHVDFAGIQESDVEKAVQADGLDVLFSDRAVEFPEWHEAHVIRSREMTTGVSQFRAMSGGNLGMTRAFYLDTGGTDETFRQWGGEDNEFGFRALMNGALVVPERQARAWHQGEGHEPTEEEFRSLLFQQPKLKNLIADLGFRKPAPGRSYAVPHCTVTVDVGSSDGVAAEDTIGSILGNTFHDLIVYVEHREDDADATEWLRRSFGSDPRVMLGGDRDPRNDHRFSPLRMEVPAGVILQRGTIGHIAAEVDGDTLGLARWAIDVDGDRAIVVARSTRAINRCLRLIADPAELDRAIATYFGEWWLSAKDYGIFSRADAMPAPATDGGVYHRDGIETVAEQISSLDEYIANLNSRRALRLADALGSLRNARSPADIRGGFRNLGAVLRRAEATTSRTKDDIAAEIDEAMRQSD